MNSSLQLRKRILATTRSASARPSPLLTGGPGAMLARSGITIAALWTAVALAASAFLLWQLGFDDSVAVNSPVLLLAFSSAVISYVLRLLRWHVLLRQAGGKVPLLPSLCLQSIGFALGATPGRAGEAFKLYLLDRHWHVPAVRSAAVLLFERLSDAVGFMVIAILGGLLLSSEAVDLDLPLGHEPILAGFSVLGQVAAPVGALVLAIVVMWRVKSGSVIPWGQTHRWSRMLAGFSAANRELLKGVAVPWAFGLTVLARLCDALAVYLVAESAGLSLSYPQAALILGTGGLAGGISLLPGGIGAADAAMAGLLIGMGATASISLSITLMVRTFTYWLWVAVGLANLVVFYRHSMKGRNDAHLPGLHPSQGA